MSKLAGIPLPTPPDWVTVRSHERPYPDHPGMTTGVVHCEGRRTTVQCSVCWRTATGATPWHVVVFAHWNFEPDEGESGHTKHRRCPRCREARRHPAVQLDMLSMLGGIA